MARSKCINWFFGRGLSIGCNLSWVVPDEWRRLPRVEAIALIKAALPKEMDRPDIDCSVIRFFLGLLSENTRPGWRHRFITTNWDFLLQREIEKFDLSYLPQWLDTSHVFHLNGTVEILEDNSRRSPFLLEEDSGTCRTNTQEANEAYNKMICDKYFVVVGMSFECETDKFLLRALGRVEDEMPIGESYWVVVNRNKSALVASCRRIQDALPYASVTPVCASLNDWLKSGTQDLRKWGALAP